MKTCIGIRREDKNRWERRVPLTPSDVARITGGVACAVQPSPIRVFGDDEYRSAGAEVREDLSECSTVFAVKEIPADLFRPGRTYVFFSHTVKGQKHNMPMLRRIMELGCTLIDYELIVDEAGRRTVFFGIHAGLAGMVETLVGLGKRLAAEGIETPLGSIRPPHVFPDLASVKAHVGEAGEAISRRGLPLPLVFGFAGYGNVSRGAQEILDCLPVVEIGPAELPSLGRGPDRHVVKVVFREEHTVEPLQGPFDLKEYFDRPERYRSRFGRHLPHLDVLVNCILWTPRHPRLVTIEQSRTLARLRVVGDVSCDVGGAIEFTHKVTTPDEPFFTFDPATGRAADGVHPSGIVVMAVDNLPCELPREASESFSRALRDLVPVIAGADWTRELDDLAVPRAVADAVVVHRGRLVPRFRHLEEAVRSEGGHP